MHSIWKLHTTHAVYHIVQHSFEKYLVPAFGLQTDMVTVGKRKWVRFALNIMFTSEETKELFLARLNTVNGSFDTLEVG